MSNYKTTVEVAELFGVHPETIRQWCKKGILKGEKRSGRDWWIDEESVDRELERRGRNEGETTY